MLVSYDKEGLSFNINIIVLLVSGEILGTYKQTNVSVDTMNC